MSSLPLKRLAVLEIDSQPDRSNARACTCVAARLGAPRAPPRVCVSLFCCSRLARAANVFNSALRFVPAPCTRMSRAKGRSQGARQAALFLVGFVSARCLRGLLQLGILRSRPGFWPACTQPASIRPPHSSVLSLPVLTWSSDIDSCA